MNTGIPLVKIADRVAETVDLNVKHVGGPLLALPPITGFVIQRETSRMHAYTRSAESKAQGV